MQVQSTCDPAFRADADALYQAASVVGAERSLGPRQNRMWKQPGFYEEVEFWLARGRKLKRDLGL